LEITKRHVSDDGDPAGAADGAALAYGFKWFEYHAGQRMTTFNFYLVIYSGLTAAYSFLLKDKSLVGSLLISFLMFFVSLLFWQLDVRNRQLITIGEKIVAAGWTKAGLDQTLDPTALSRQRHPEGLRFRQLFDLVFLVGGVVGLAAFVYALAALS
jgi:hypothetical protein